MSSPIQTSSTKPVVNSGSPLFSARYDDVLRNSELTQKTLLNDDTFIATVLEVNQQLNCYKIRTAGMSDLIAVALDSAGSALALSSATSGLYGVGTKVLAMTTPALGVGYAVILGGIAPHMGLIDSLGSPELTLSSPVGSFRDVISDKGLLNSPYNNFNGGRPVDVYPGDTTLLNTLGCGLVVGALQTALISGFDCSLECHYIDALMRVNSFNYEHNTAGSEVSMLADTGDYTEVKRLNPFVIESLGATEQYGNIPQSAATDRTTYPDRTAVTGTYKLQDPNQVGWWRYTELAGYLGNLKLAFATVPKLDAVRTSTTKTQDEYGVFREHVDNSGAYTVVSAKSIALVKDCFIPVPKQVYAPEDSRGDKSAAILQARTENAKNVNDYEITGYDSDPSAALFYAATSSDAAAYRTHRTLVNFRERPTDWLLHEIDEVDLAGFKSEISSTGFINAQQGPSQQRMFANMPKVGKLKINAREEVKYFASRSMIMLHEDGSIHIQDGYGAAISMRAGSIDISCPGDITLRPGRNLVGIAGDTISNIAGNDVELSANLGDLRLQADRNVSVLAGNDGIGGILLESKAEASNLYEQDADIFKDPNNNANSYRGIWFKAPGASIGSISSEVYLGNAKDNCTLYVDAGKGSTTFAGSRTLFESTQTMFVTNKDNANASTNIIVSDSGVAMQTAGSFFLQGRSFVASGKETDMQILVKGRAVFSDSVLAKSYAGISTSIGKVEDRVLEEVVKSITTATNKQSEVITTVLTSQAELDNAISISLVGKPSSSLKYLTFCYPNTELRGIPAATLYLMIESDWQQAYRTQGVGAALVFKGVDPTKKSGTTSPGITDSNTYFWPGATALSGKFAKLKTSDRYVDEKLRFQKEGFDAPLAPIDSPTSFESAYTVLTENRLRTKV